MAKIRVRRDTTAAWQAANPVLLPGELCWDTVLHKLKVGDGITAWSDLPIASGEVGPAGPAGPAGIAGPTGPAISETNVTRTTSVVSGLVTAQLEASGPPLPGRMYIVEGVQASVSAGGALGTINLILPVSGFTGSTAYPAGKTQYFNAIVFNDTSEPLNLAVLEYTPSYLQFLGGPPVIAPGTMGILNFMIVSRDGGLLMFVSNIGQ